MSRLPQPGSDDGTWGSILNDFLSVSHQSDGSIRPAAVTPAITAAGVYTKPSNGIPASDLDTATQASLTKANSALQSAPVTSVNSKTGVVTLTSSDVGAVQQTASLPTQGGSPGFWAGLSLTNYSTNGTDAEPFMISGYRSGTSQRAFWVNENGSPRGASVNSEPALKLFGPAADTTYSGLIVQFLSRWNGASDTQRHLWGIQMNGNPVIGSNKTVAAHTIILGATDTVPTGLPPGTVIVRKP